MRHKKSVTILSVVIMLLSVIAASTGIFSTDGPGAYQVETVRGDQVTVYGMGIYKHMSIDVAPQGIAQDYVTLFVAVSLLLLSLVWARKGSMKGRFLLAGTLSYFLVTYLFYLVMGMYNLLFLVYAALLGTSFFALAQTLFAIGLDNIADHFEPLTPVRSTGGFLIFNSLTIGLMWLGIVVPPLLNGTIIPEQVEHYTTLIVQGLDLGLLLPLSFVAGLLFMKKKPLGYLLAPVYFVFLSILMTALTAKVIAMGLLGQNVIPAIIIIPLVGLISITCTFLILKNIREADNEFA
jgi:hypothetical protein